VTVALITSSSLVDIFGADCSASLRLLHRIPTVHIGLLVSVDDLLGDPSANAQAKGGASAVVESGLRRFKISDPRSIIPMDLTSFCHI
jgi:hypothetical protein